MVFFWKKLRVAMIVRAGKRSQYLVKHHIFAGVGDHFLFQPRIIPEDAKYIRFHNNDHVAGNVSFVCHDIIHDCFNGLHRGVKLPRYKGCVEVMDNVFIGSGSRIMANVRIGPNAIVASGSVVTKDVPPGTVVGGVPARVIGSFEELYQKRLKEYEAVGDVYGDPEAMWRIFDEKHKA